MKVFGLVVTKALVKSYLRSLFVAVAASVFVYASTGHELKWNLVTLYGVLATLLIPVLPVLVRYFSTQDPAFGRVAQLAADAAVKRLQPLADAPAGTVTVVPDAPVLPVAPLV